MADAAESDDIGIGAMAGEVVLGRRGDLGARHKDDIVIGGCGESVVFEVIYEGEVARRKADFKLSCEFAGLFRGGGGGSEEEKVASLVGELEKELWGEIRTIAFGAGNLLELIPWN